MLARATTDVFRGILALALLGSLLVGAPTVTNAAIDAGNVATLQLKWDFPTTGAVTASPVPANGLLYVASWNSILYALDPDDGSVVWSFNTAAGGLGLQSTPLVTPGGDVCIGDSNAHVWCRDGLTGAPVWDKQITRRRACNNHGWIQCLVNSDCPAPSTCGYTDHVWSGLATAAGRLFVSIASHSDVPCTKGRVVALDLGTGADLWEFLTVPDKICDTDTTTVCAADSDCPAGGSCIDGIGAGVTATVSTDPTGAFVYMSSVGCYTYPSIGDSDSILKLDAATGAVVWKTRVDPVEQFGACSNDPSIDCGYDAECGASNTCNEKANYHDFGFLNGPIPVDVGAPVNKTLLIAGSKNGTLYALDEATGAIEWFNEVEPKPVTPAFAGFGLFNGPLAVLDGRVHAALYEFSPPINPAPDHIQAFDLIDGTTLWTDNAGRSWSGMGAANGVVYSGNQDTKLLTMNNAVTGQRITQFILPNNSTAVSRVDGNRLYVGYGVFSTPAGVRAYELPPPPGLEKCRRTVNKETAKYLQQEAKTISKCELAKVKDKLGAGTVCIRDDVKTVDKLVKIESKKIAKIAKACGGADKVCGGSLTDETGADAIGFGGSCPGFEGRGLCTGGTNNGDVCAADTDCTGGGTCATCDGAMAPNTCTDAVTCVDCIAAVATRQMNDLLADNLVDNDPSLQKDENKCQQTILKEVWKFYSAKSKILQKCWDKGLLGKHGDACPDAAAAAGSEAKKAADKIAKAESKKVAKVCKACGGPDKLCGGGDDLAVTSIYNPVPTCPAVTVPVAPFTDCGAITIGSMQELVDCLDCVAEFKIDCTAANQVPSLAGYPVECQ
jgi:outer membrane protein assembly factor BamB